MEACTRCVVQPEPRPSLAYVFTPYFTGTNTEPRGSVATREAPQSPSGAPLQRSAYSAPHPAPHRSVTYLL